MGLHVLSNLLQTRSNVTTLVQLSKQSVGIRSRRLGRGRRGGHKVSSRGRGTRGRGSSGSGGSGGSGRGGGLEGITTLGVPGESSGVVLLDVFLHFVEEFLELVAPVDLLFFLALVQLQDLVGPEEGRVEGLLDEGGGGGGNDNPVHVSDGLGEGGEVLPLREKKKKKEDKVNKNVEKKI